MRNYTEKDEEEKNVSTAVYLGFRWFLKTVIHSIKDSAFICIFLIIFIYSVYFFLIHSVMTGF